MGFAGLVSRPAWPILFLKQTNFSPARPPELSFPQPHWSSERSRYPALPQSTRQTEVCTMLSWVVTFLIIALIAGILGFGGLAGASIEIAKIIFFIAVVLFVVSAVVGVARGRRI
jgi:uncharacterized membrane protein YtjA (UPF0391 family)